MITNWKFDRFSRRAASAAVVLLALGLVPTLACAATEGSGAATGARAQGDLVGMLPDGAVTVGYFDYAALRQSPLYSLIDEDGDLSTGALEELEEFIARTGMDPRTDIHRVAFAAGRLGAETPDDAAFVIAASFQRARLREALAPYESTEYAGQTVWRLRDLEGDAGEDTEESEGSGYLTILDDDTLAVGGLEMVQAIVDVRGGSASARANDRLAGLIEDVDPDSQVWIVSAQDRLVADLAPRGDGPTPSIPVDKIRSVIFSGNFSDGLQLQLRGRTEAEADAKLLGDSLNGMLAFGKMMVQSNAPEIFQILDRGVRAGSSGRDVTVRADLSVAELEQLRAYLERTFEETGEEKIGG